MNYSIHRDSSASFAHRAQDDTTGGEYSNFNHIDGYNDASGDLPIENRNIQISAFQSPAKDSKYSQHFSHNNSTSNFKSPRSSGRKGPKKFAPNSLSFRLQKMFRQFDMEETRVLN